MRKIIDTLDFEQKEFLTLKIKPELKKINDDPLVDELPDDVTFYDVYMRPWDVYLLLPSADIFIRENVFGLLADQLNIPYDWIYDRWLFNYNDALTEFKRIASEQELDIATDPYSIILEALMSGRASEDGRYKILFDIHFNDLTSEILESGLYKHEPELMVQIFYHSKTLGRKVLLGQGEFFYPDGTQYTFDDLVTFVDFYNLEVYKVKQLLQEK